MLIEYDGKQHFKPIDRFGGEEQFIRQKKVDKMKNLLAKKNNMRLIRLPYTKFKTLENYLLFRLSKFYRYRVKNRFYKGLLEIVNGEQLPDYTRSKDVKQHLVYVKE